MNRVSAVTRSRHRSLAPQPRGRRRRHRLPVHHRLRKPRRAPGVPDGTITTIAGSGIEAPGLEGLPAVRSPLINPSGLAVGSDGTVYFSDEGDHVVWSVGADGILRRVAGNGSPEYSGDRGPAGAAGLQRPTGLAVADDGNVFVADTGNAAIRRVDPDGVITTMSNPMRTKGGGNTPLNGIPPRSTSTGTVPRGD